MPRVHISPSFARLVALVALPALSAPPASGQEQPERWNNSSELSFVQTGGNAESATFGLANTLTRVWSATQLKLELGGVRTSTTTFSRRAVGTADDYQLNESSDSRVSSENYYARLRLDREFSRRTAFFVQSGWLRNTFQGVDHRYLSVLGLSNQWLDNDVQRLSTAYGVTYTKQDDVVPDPTVSSSFVGAQVSVDYWRRVTSTTEWTSRLVLDENGDRTADFRADWVNSIGVAMSENLALKTTLQVLFDNQPSLVNVPLESPTGEPAGMVAVELDEFDRVLTVALVVSF